MSKSIDLISIHEKCGNIFNSELLESPNGRSVACSICHYQIKEGYKVVIMSIHSLSNITFRQ